MTEFTAKGKLYARLVYAGKRVWADEVPQEYQQECYDAYTDFYQYQPPLTPINEVEE